MAIGNSEKSTKKKLHSTTDKNNLLGHENLLKPYNSMNFKSYLKPNYIFSIKSFTCAFIAIIVIQYLLVKSYYPKYFEPECESWKDPCLDNKGRVFLLKKH